MSKLYCFLCLLFLLGGCAGSREVILPSDGSIVVKGDKIWKNDKPFAEIRFFFSAKLSENMGEAYLFNSSIQHRGLAIYYYNTGKLFWIFPKRGLDDDIKKGYYSARGQSDGYFGWVFDVNITPDGKYVMFETAGLLWASSHKYVIEY